MSRINILDSATVDKIAAGEVVERPANVVKELVENAIDAGAENVTVEIREGGLSLIRVTDNGSGIESSELKKAFLRHATSKIERAEDLGNVESLGFRGEALSSISAVCQVELITKTRESLIGTKVTCSGGMMTTPQEVGAPDGTTVLARNIFFNTPVRKKFLKSAITEGSYISDIMQHIALSKPGISFKFISNGQTKFFTSGNGNLSEVIYRIYGKETRNALVYICKEMPGVKLEGYLGKPVLNRSSRSYETVFVNGRYIRSNLVSRAIEEGYKGYLMQHKYPFCVLHFTIDTSQIDVNVHPTKMDIRIFNPEPFVRFVQESIHEGLLHSELIPAVVEPEARSKKEIKAEEKELTKYVPEPFEAKRASQAAVNVVDSVIKETQGYHVKDVDVTDGIEETFFTEDQTDVPESTTDNTMETQRTAEKLISNPIFNRVFGSEKEKNTEKNLAENTVGNVIKQKDQIIIQDVNQLAMFDESIMKGEDSYEILGQIFDTYWILAFHEKMYLVDQHAAHEKVKYERFVKRLHESQVTSQTINPPVIVTLSDREKEVLLRYFDTFAQMGFEIEEFGGEEYALRSVPTDLYGCSEKELLLSMIDELLDFPVQKDASLVLDKIASMACKAAVKGNNKLSRKEAEALMKELLSLENPFQCPHGRPTIVSMSKYEVDKKFKRIL